MSFSKLKILLLQARKLDDPAMKHEVDCFLRKTGLRPEQMTCHDLLGGVPSVKSFKKYDALMVGGSGDFYVSVGNLPFFDETLEFLQEVVTRKHPMFASCFGYQCMVRAMGGKIIRDVGRCEVGSFDLELTEAGKKDEIFSQLDEKFVGQMGHKDRATALPERWINLVQSERSPIQAYRVPGTPIWATQFHPELDKASNEERYEIYKEGYSEHLSDDQLDTAIMEFRESEETSRLLKLFLNLVFV